MEAEKRLRHISNHDMLPGLPNRALFLDRLDQALGHAKRNQGRGAVLLIDLDNFKDINDTLGHAAGDALLQATAERLAGCVGGTDTLARLGGDEFAIILVDLAHATDVAKLAQKIVTNQSRPFTIDGRTMHSSASVGVMVYADGVPGNILRGADVALYRAKGEGRGTYRFFNAGMNEEVQRRQAVEDDIRLAIERGEFVLFYQPKLNLKTNRVEGLEALIRWQHPDRGLLLPGEFISIAESSKLIVPMGNWVIREACTQNKAWQDAGLPRLKVAVNLSAVQFRRRHLKDHITRVLDDTGLEPKFLDRKSVV
jgi:diguanylate cyclase (GGDEF)-like protein